MSISRNAGRFTTIAYADGSPIFTELVAKRFVGDSVDDTVTIIHHLTLSDLEDLHYVVGRILESVGTEERESRERQQAAAIARRMK